jgi:hypothetical protein
MGLSIHYEGRLKTSVELKELIDEVIDVCESLNWPHQHFHDTLPKDNAGQMVFKQELFGVSFTPPECETVFLNFETNGRMSDPVSKMIYDNFINGPSEYYVTSVKTQYASMQVHKQIIDLFRHLSKKYFSEFNMTDEAGYWETGDEKVLHDSFYGSKEMWEKLADKLGTPKMESESIQDYLRRAYKPGRN